ncbi:Peptide deformylase [Caldithrix abyssi DSM 13497]|uniref:Peptide deformylase n=1 Tax=Caldithrix abyssi DSM 13497 TaxID=880073 RepID=H1XNN1_CALAY|nr:peptide deformylase [Caldithrix abyssi]APF19367.1 def peptide deformylase [Caldithrix abyssi DSM 13497]EHO43269.1 Peptide deformylase [Caldithrix abyssi DSM 13497]
MKYKIRYIGDPVLRKVAEPITEFDDKLKNFAEDLIDVMHVEDGIGLAAPQIGISRQIIAVDASELVENEFPRVFVNPQILEASGEWVVEEGCLSIPGVREEVTRPETILLKFQDVVGESFTQEFSGWLSRILQHEIDHLNGILFVDRISPIRRNLLIAQKAIPEKY